MTNATWALEPSLVFAGIGIFKKDPVNAAVRDFEKQLTKQVARRSASISTMPALYTAYSESSAVGAPLIDSWISAFDLQLQAQFVVSRLGSEFGRPTPSAMARFGAILNTLVTDGGPTPQPTLTLDGGIEVRWRVNDAKVVAVAESDGSAYLSGVEADGHEAFDIELASNEVLSVEVVEAARAMLSAMSGGISSRVAARS
ncbi:hypothetical protein [Amnibacterium endophyticum]|uniref:Uncharacterized protein n=1 Tax=Amnibacterium endophyticum TaxID=2109337 RepID=A0ABW4LFH2_9MICO